MYTPLKRPAGLFVSCTRNFRSWSWCGVTIEFTLNQFLLGQSKIFWKVLFNILYIWFVLLQLLCNYGWCLAGVSLLTWLFCLWIGCLTSLFMFRVWLLNLLPKLDCRAFNSCSFQPNEVFNKKDQSAAANKKRYTSFCSLNNLQVGNHSVKALVHAKYVFLPAKAWYGIPMVCAACLQNLWLRSHTSLPSMIVLFFNFLLRIADGFP